VLKGDSVVNNTFGCERTSRSNRQPRNTPRGSQGPAFRSSLPAAPFPASACPPPAPCKGRVVQRLWFQVSSFRFRILQPLLVPLRHLARVMKGREILRFVFVVRLRVLSHPHPAPFRCCDFRFRIVGFEFRTKISYTCLSSTSATKMN